MSLLSSINLFGGVDLGDIYRHLDRADQGQFLNAMRLIDPRSAEQLHSAHGGPVAEGMRVTLPSQPAAGTQPATAGPRAAYSQRAGRAGQGYSTITPDAQVHLSTGKTVKGSSLTKYLDARMRANPEMTQEFMANNGIIRENGVYKIANSRVNAGATESSSGGLSFGGRVLRWGAVAAGAATMGIPGAILAFMGVGALQSAGRAISGAGLGSIGSGLSGGGLALTALGADGGRNPLVSTAALGAAAPGMADMGRMSLMANAAQLAGQDGLAFQLRKQMRSIVADHQDQSMINMINSSNMPIEDLVFYFLAYMSQKYEDKLREKMEETALQEKLERKQQRRLDEARMKGGLIKGALGAFLGPVGIGVGEMVGTGMEMHAQKVNEIESAINGGGKSSTLLANEIQVLMHKWKQLTEMSSNIIKTMDEMKMTSIRNIR